MHRFIKEKENIGHIHPIAFLLDMISGPEFISVDAAQS
jgi:hypothetical protein